MSVGSCGPFGDGDDFDVDTAYDAMCIECDALRVENRLLHLEMQKIREVLLDITETLHKLTEEKQ